MVFDPFRRTPWLAREPQLAFASSLNLCRVPTSFWTGLTSASTTPSSTVRVLGIRHPPYSPLCSQMNDPNLPSLNLHSNNPQPIHPHLLTSVYPPPRSLSLSPQTAGHIFAVMAIGWSTFAAARLFEQTLNMEHQRYLVAYPVGLLYSVFVLITIF